MTRQFILVSGYKGGVSKTTTAIHIATFFAEKLKTLLVDGDQNRSALRWSERGSGLPFDLVDEHQALKTVADYEMVVIDTPARPRTDDLKDLAKGCDLLVLPTACDIGSVEATISTGNDLPKGVKHRILITQVPPKPSRDGEELYLELVAAKIPVFKTMIRRSVGFSKSMLDGVSIRDLKDSRTKVAWRDYLELGKEIEQCLQD